MKPKTIILVRHGQSQGNVSKEIHSKMPDYAIRLTEIGVNQALNVGLKINKIIKSQSYGVYYSPYFRARQTMDWALDSIKHKPVFLKEEPRIREQEYNAGVTNFDNGSFERGMINYGKFFYRIDGAESPVNVYDRVSDFIGTLNRDFEKKDYPKNTIIFTHGMSMRVFVMRFCKFTVEEFETWRNPENGSIYVLKLQNNNKYKLITKIEKHKEGYGFKYIDKTIMS